MSTDTTPSDALRRQAIWLLGYYHLTEHGQDGTASRNCTDERCVQVVRALDGVTPDATPQAAEPLVADLFELPELRHSDPGNGPCPHPYCVAKAARPGDGEQAADADRVVLCPELDCDFDSYTLAEMDDHARAKHAESVPTDTCRTCGQPQPCGFKTPHPVIAPNDGKLLLHDARRITDAIWGGGNEVTP